MNLQVEIAKLSIEELRDLNSKVVALIKAKKAVVGQEVAIGLHQGQKVTINHRTCVGKEYEIVKVNRTKAVVKELGKSTQYTVDFSMIVPS